MSSLRDHMARFDAYLHKEMAEGERAVFESELREDAELKKQFDEHCDFLDQFSEGVQYKETSKQLSAIHKSIYEPEKNFFTSKQFLIPVAIAASIVMLLLVINPFILPGNEVAEGSQGGTEEPNAVNSVDTSVAYEVHESYAAEPGVTTDDTSVDTTDSGFSVLISPPDTIYGSDGVLSHTMHAPVFTAPTATAFMITPGYFLTSSAAVGNKKVVMLQQAYKNFTFEAIVIHRDKAGFVVLECHSLIRKQLPREVPFAQLPDTLRKGSRVVTLGYRWSNMMAERGTLGKVSEKNLEVMMTHGSLFDGAPLLTLDGKLAGMLINNRDTRHVTSAISYHYIAGILDELYKNGVMANVSANRFSRAKLHSNPVERVRSCVFEVHP